MSGSTAATVVVGGSDVDVVVVAVVVAVVDVDDSSGVDLDKTVPCRAM